MSIDREKNPSLKEYKIVARAPNHIEYVQKGSDKDEQDDNFLDREILQTLESMKKLYQTETGVNAPINTNN